MENAVFLVNLDLKARPERVEGLENLELLGRLAHQENHRQHRVSLQHLHHANHALKDHPALQAPQARLEILERPEHLADQEQMHLLDRLAREDLLDQLENLGHKDHLANLAFLHKVSRLYLVNLERWEIQVSKANILQDD